MRRRRNTVVVKQQRPSLLGTMARTAVVAGTATAVSKSVSNAMPGPAQQPALPLQPAQPVQAPQPDMVQQPAPQAAAPGVMSPEKITMLQQLGELRAAGILTEAEFETEKAKILAS